MHNRRNRLQSLFAAVYYLMGEELDRETSINSRRMPGTPRSRPEPPSQSTAHPRRSHPPALLLYPLLDSGEAAQDFVSQFVHPVV